MEYTEGNTALRQGERFTLDQWRSWPKGERWELIGGIAWAMSPAPRVEHQDYTGNLYHSLMLFLEGKPCHPFIAPIDLFLPNGVEDSEHTVVEPDVIVVCDPGKIQSEGIHGAPDFAAEVLSPSTSWKDWNEKKSLYECSGVGEYWIINPDSGSIFQYVLKDGRYGPVTEYLRGSCAKSVILLGFAWQVPVLFYADKGSRKS